MVVKSAVYGALERGRDGAAKEDGEDFVADVVGFVFVEGEDDEGVVHEVGVLEEGIEE